MSEEQVAEVVADEAAVAQSVPDDWRSMIPEEIRDHKSLAHFTDVGAMAKSLVNAQSMIGADKVAIPGKHATDEDWGEVWRKLGRPDTPDGYELVNEMPEGIEQNDDMLNWFRATAHEIGMTPTQAQKMLGRYNQFLGTQMGTDEGQIEQLRETTEIELKKEYGAAFADRVSNGNAVMQEFGGEGLTELQLADGRLLGDHPDIIKLMVNVGEFINSKIGEDVLAGTKSSGGLAPDDARAKLEEIRAPNSPYWDQRHPEHQFYVQEGLRYQEMLNVGS
mgnify:CR=1 FL=1|tara:strand:+ start:1936 stop:2766 length:831 start_codon:yes stop_codon:yes gene_type:complete